MASILRKSFVGTCWLFLQLLIHADLVFGVDESSYHPTGKLFGSIRVNPENLTANFMNARSGPLTAVHLSNSTKNDDEYFDEDTFQLTTSSAVNNILMGQVTPSPGSLPANVSSPKKKYSRKVFCSKSLVHLNTCLKSIPPMPDIGIPSTHLGVDAACRAFNVGMSCVDTWTKKCLAKSQIDQFKASVSGAHETFTFLCRDAKFRREFLKHGQCFKKISPQWDECSRHFIENMKRTQHYANNSTIQCCVRISFIQCVREISHYHCKRPAAVFLHKLAETLVRATMPAMRNHAHLHQECADIQMANCSMISQGAQLIQINQNNIIPIVSLFTFIFTFWNLWFEQ